MSTASSSGSQWSPFRSDVLTDPAAGHRQLLGRCPVHHYGDFEPPFYTLSRYEDVDRALRDIDTFSSEFGQGPRFSEPVGMLCDPPQHTFFRKLLQDWFSPRAIDALRPSVVALTDELIDAIKGRGERFDVHDDFAFPLPVLIIAGLLGVPEQDLEQFKRWSDVQVAAMGAEDPSGFASEMAAFQAYLDGHLDARRKLLGTEQSAPDDLLTVIAGAEHPDGTAVAEIDALSVLSQLLVGGNETTTSLITNLVWRLLESRQQWELLQTNPDLIPAAVEESLRFDPPVLGLYRNTTRAVTLHDVTIPEGSKVLINYAAANRDPGVFADPDVFDVTRERKRHMAFGLGLHMCIGAPMARLEAEIALAALLQSFPNLQLLDAGERIAPWFLWGRRKLPVRRA